MKSAMKLALATIAMATAAASIAAAAPPPMPYVNPRGGPVSEDRTGFDVHDQSHMRTELTRLREDAIRQQKADGGKLTPAHQAELNQRLAVLKKEACDLHMGRC